VVVRLMTTGQQEGHVGEDRVNAVDKMMHGVISRIVGVGAVF